MHRVWTHTPTQVRDNGRMTKGAISLLVEHKEPNLYVEMNRVIQNKIAALIANKEDDDQLLNGGCCKFTLLLHFSSGPLDAPYALAPLTQTPLAQSTTQPPSRPSDVLVYVSIHGA